ncbi:DUF2750 domain-containing protein [Cohnella yongneupensis]|uniref:DUF2750 domain-containing protein n=1 Tax=Cohnella yongneupensis TaxID=425006 RepID=A0ABW0R0P2_9BACL
MSQSAAQWSAFVYESIKNRIVWTIYDSGGIPCPINFDGKRAMPFWSSINRVEKIINNIDTYKGFKPREINLEDFIEKWLEGLQKDNLLVGVNWTGSRAIGFDLEPEKVKARLNYELSKTTE